MTSRGSTVAAAAAAVLLVPPVLVSVIAGASSPASACSSAAGAPLGAARTADTAGQVSWNAVARVAYDAGFRGADLYTATAITQPESGRIATATHRNIDGSTDYGLWQINSVHAAVLASGDWRDRAANARMAYAVYIAAGRSFTPWTTYRHGLHVPYLSAAQQAVSLLPAGGQGPAPADAAAAPAAAAVDCVPAGAAAAGAPANLQSALQQAISTGVTWPFLAALARSSGLPVIVTATTNGHHVTDSYHYRGQAIDITDAPGSVDSAGLLKLNQFFARYAPGLAEIIYAGPGGTCVKDTRIVACGGIYGPWMATHHDHNHVAATPATLTRLRTPLPPPAAAGGTAQRAVQWALANSAPNGTPHPYAWGGDGPTSYDCSGFVRAAEAAAGRPGLPHNAAAQYTLTSPVPLGQEQPGDLIFSEFTGSEPGHVGIITSPGQYAHAPHTGDVTRVATYTGRTDIRIGRLQP